MARDYELGMVINPDVGDEQTRTIVERVTQYVSGNGGQVVRVNAWGRRHLAYPIEHHRDGLYFWFDLILPAETVAGLDRMIRVNEDVVRHLVKLRDPRVVAQTRQREAEADAQAAAHAAAQAAQAAQAEQVAQAAQAEEPAAGADEAEAVTEPTTAEGAAAEEAAEPAESQEEAQVVTSDAEAEA